MKRILSLAMMLAIVVTLFAACGTSGGSTNATPGTGGASSGGTVSGSAASGSAASAEERVIKMGYPDPAGPYSHYSYFVDYFNEELDKLTGGTIRFEGYADSQLGNETDMLNALSDGSLESACLSVGVYSSQIPSLQIFSMPYLFNYPEQYAVLTDNPEFMKRFTDVIENDWGIMFMGDPIYGGRYELLTTRDINSIEDMKDLVIRITTSNTMQATWEAVDAIPTVIAFSEVYTAFSTGVCDAVYVPIETYVFKGIYDCAKSIAMVTPEPCLGWPMMSMACWGHAFLQEPQPLQLSSATVG